MIGTKEKQTNMENTKLNELENRAAQLASVRGICDFLDANPSVPLPFQIKSDVIWRIYCVETLAAIIDIARTFGPQVERIEDDDVGVTLARSFGTIKLGVHGEKDLFYEVNVRPLPIVEELMAELKAVA